MTRQQRNQVVTWAVLALLVIGAIVVLNAVLSAASGLLWPAVLVACGAGLGIWWSKRVRR